MDPQELARQAEQIMQLAQDGGVANNFFFATTFNRYRVQLNILSGLEQALEESGMLVSKEYVKGRANVYANPAVAEYNRTTDSANKTVAALLRILRELGQETRQEEDPLMKLLAGDQE